MSEHEQAVPQEEEHHLSVTEAHLAAGGDVAHLLEEQKQRLPWFLVSIAFHAFLFFCLSFIVLDKDRQQEDREVITNIIPEDIPEMIEPEREVVETDKPIKQDE